MLKPTFLCCLTTFLLFAASGLHSNAAELQELQYSGTLTSHPRGKESQPVKTFSAMLLAEKDQQQGVSCFWQTDENGSGPHWPESFGRFRPTDEESGTTRRPGILYEHDRLPSPIPLPPLSLPTARLEEGKTWTVDRLKYEVKEVDLSDADSPVARVVVTSNFGRAQELLYDPATGHLREADVKLFLGRGDEFSLTLSRTETHDLSPSAAEKVRQAQQLLLEMQEELDRPDNSIRKELSDQQLQTIAERLPELDKLTQNTPLQSLTIAIHRDLKSQQDRADTVEQLADKYVGQSAPKMELTQLDGTPLPADELQDKILVLHFWKYHDDPLQEPYGQVGYLDFLHGKRGKLGVKFLGVAVDPRFANPQKSRTTMLAVKKLVSFMNLSYDIVRDDGALLEKFGDPPAVGADLPLWVVIGADGKITHYKVGFYDVDPREGLQELDAAIIKAIKDRRANQKD